MPDISNERPGTARAETNRANAQNSTGPRTQAGKQRSSLNALRHGLTGQTIVLSSDDLAAYQLLCKGLHDHYQPKNPMEVQLTQTLADLSWRLNRGSAVEIIMLTIGVNGDVGTVDTEENGEVQRAITAAKTFREKNQSLANLSLYEHRLSLRFERTLKLLNAIQATRQTQETQDMFDAANILQTYKNKDVTYDPSEDGFVFSNADIETYIRRRDRKSHAYRVAPSAGSSMPS